MGKKSRKINIQRMSYPKQAGISPSVVEPTAPPCEQPVVVQQVFVVQQPGAQPVYVGDNIVTADQPPPYNLISQQPHVQPVPAVQGKRKKRRKNGNGDPEFVKCCCRCGEDTCSYICESICCLLCCSCYVLKCIFD